MEKTSFGASATGGISSILCALESLELKHLGEVAEWSNATVLKTVDPQGSVGSNPTLSAIFPVPSPAMIKPWLVDQRCYIKNARVGLSICGMSR